MASCDRRSGVALDAGNLVGEALACVARGEQCRSAEVHKFKGADRQGPHGGDGAMATASTSGISPLRLGAHRKAAELESPRAHSPPEPAKATTGQCAPQYAHP
ncbi:hypothetical protein BGZ61DRAFT_471663 [Ilyonectria robusta]|uniref:uncharacterized protein n=1 Tax=Ilyonectria robusta TaxID=1079257 RepID=UPI001E8DDDB3|nr:uncharacterized protein BGZ61DRAFT_471663 [Ilyonectria robusta]KAH8738326.1 hypothetical protein BGZ61DRAFT_471663 [Ilyonectria robusta]